MLSNVKRALRLLCCLALPLGAMSFVGCQTLSYYKQAIKGQYQIVVQRRPIKHLISDPRTPSPLKAKLELVLRIREFAEKELRLPANGHYLRYAQLNRRYVVWNVHAAPALSLEPKTWWYPIVGRLKYRGYFSEADARSYADKLKKQGFDVYVEGVEAYSTLGWFRDPVLSTFIHHNETELAEIIFHELAHQRVFAQGDTDFDEAFATTVGAEGVRRWLHAKKDAAAYEQYLAAHRRQEQFVRLILNARRELERIYNGSRPAGTHLGDGDGREPAASQRRQKEAVITKVRQQYEQMKDQWAGCAGYDSWFAQPLNNAQLNTVATYEELVPAFQRLLDLNGGDLEKFYRVVQGLAKAYKDKRHDELTKWTFIAPAF